MKKTIMVFLLATTILIAQVASAEFASIGFVVTNPDGTIAFLEVCGDGYELELNEIEGSDFLVDFDSATSSDTEINELDLYLIAIEGTTEEEILTYYEGRNIPESFLGYLMGAAIGIFPYAIVQTGEWDDALGGFPVHLIDAAKKFILDIDVPMTFPGDFPCGEYTVGNEYNGIGFSLVIKNPSCDEDGDGDSISNVCDSCPDTQQDTNVDEYGCSKDRSISQMVEDSCPVFPETEWKNHGEFVRCVAHAAHILFAEGVISLEEKGAIISEAARSNIGKRDKENPKPEAENTTKGLKKTKKDKKPKKLKKK